MEIFNKDQLINNITKLADRNKLSVNRALIESKVGKDFIYNMRKNSVPSVESVLKLAEYFNVSIDYLLGRDN